MKLFFSFSLIVSLLPLLSQAQSPDSSLFNESGYIQKRQGVDAESAGELYSILYRNTQDTTYFFKKTFLDSSYQQLHTKSFYWRDLLVGPYTEYKSEALTFQGYYKKGLLDGETITYNQGKIIQRAHYVDGVKTGLWEEFDLDGKPTRKITYDGRGHLISEEKLPTN